MLRAMVSFQIKRYCKHTVINIESATDIESAINIESVCSLNVNIKIMTIQIILFLKCQDYVSLTQSYLLIRGDLLTGLDMKYLMKGSSKYPCSHIDSLLAILLSLVL